MTATEVSSQLELVPILTPAVWTKHHLKTPKCSDLKVGITQTHIQALFISLIKKIPSFTVHLATKTAIVAKLNLSSTLQPGRTGSKVLRKNRAPTPHLQPNWDLHPSSIFQTYGLLPWIRRTFWQARRAWRMCRTRATQVLSTPDTQGLLLVWPSEVRWLYCARHLCCSQLHMRASSYTRPTRCQSTHYTHDKKKKKCTATEQRLETRHLQKCYIKSEEKNARNIYHTRTSCTCIL